MGKGCQNVVGSQILPGQDPNYWRHLQVENTIRLVTLTSNSFSHKMAIVIIVCTKREREREREGGGKKD